MVYQLETPRLYLRQWRADDLPAFARMTADPEVMHYFPKTLDKAESDALASRIQSLLGERGWGFWALELKETQSFIGFVGLHVQSAEVVIPHTPFVEIGWRLDKAHWRKGYTYEAATATMDFAFDTLALEHVFAFTLISNSPSRGVMEKLGMVNTQQDFDHPNLLDLPDDKKRHCLYKITCQQWRDGKGG